MIKNILLISCVLSVIFILYSIESNDRLRGTSETKIVKLLDEKYVLEIQTQYQLGYSLDIFPTYFSEYQRALVKDRDGNVVAFTPTRIKAIDYCPSIERCYIFTWKTAYPWPSIFKIDQNLFQILNTYPPMVYSTKGVPGSGVQGVYNPLLGLYGLYLLIIEECVYFIGSLLFSGLILSLLFFLNNKKRDDLVVEGTLSSLFIIAVSLVVCVAIGTYYFNIAIYISNYIVLTAIIMIEMAICKLTNDGRSKRLFDLLLKILAIMLLLWVLIGFVGLKHTQSY